MRENEPPAFGASHASTYAQGTPRKVPGFDGLQRMTSQLLGERVPNEGRVLVLGAGGGLELKTLADDHAGWRFVGVDPSADMLDAARQIAGAHSERIDLIEGYIDAAPEEPFDGATCILTFHFIPREQRLETLRQIHRRLVPGAPLILAHVSFTQDEPARSRWIERHVAYSGVAPEAAQAAQEAIGTRLTILSPQEEVAMLGEAGFSDVSLFYAGLSFRGWVGYA